MTQTTDLPIRSEIPEQFTWNAPSVFASPEEMALAFEEVNARMADLQAFRDRLSEGPQVLLDCFHTREAVQRVLGKLFVYAGMSYAVDTTNQEAAARRNQVQALAARVYAAASFIEPALIAIGFDTLREWMQSTPDLAIYAHYFDRLERQQAHVRSPEVEALLSGLSDP